MFLELRTTLWSELHESMRGVQPVHVLKGSPEEIVVNSCHPSVRQICRNVGLEVHVEVEHKREEVLSRGAQLGTKFEMLHPSTRYCTFRELSYNNLASSNFTLRLGFGVWGLGFGVWGL